MDREDTLEPPYTCMKLFVAGIPYGVSLSDLSGFFRSFGPFWIDVKEFKQRSLTTRSKGYVILKTLDRQAGHRLLSFGCLQYKERSLSVMPYFSGTELKDANRKLNQQRFILKRIPKNIQMTEIVAAMQDQWGKVRSIFQFNRVSKKSGGHGKFKSYSITLEEPIQVSAMDSEPTVSLPGDVIAPLVSYSQDFLKGKQVSSMKVKLEAIKAGSLLKGEDHYASSTELAVDGRAQIDADHYNSFTNQLSKTFGSPGPSGEPRNDIYDAGHCHQKVAVVRQPLSQRHAGFEIHFLKPVESRYHLVAAIAKGALAANQLQGSFRAGKNQRFNLSSKPAF